MMARWIVRAGLVAAVLMAAGRAWGDASNRHEMFTQQAAKGPHAEVVAATFYGTAKLESFVGGGQLADGTIVAAGNFVGPDVPKAERSITIGKGERRNFNPFEFGRDSAKREAEQAFNDANPDTAGMVVLFDEKLAKAKLLVRFDFGVASISAATVTADGKAVIVSGRATKNFRAVGAAVTPVGTATSKYGNATNDADVMVARINLPEGRLAWAQVLGGAGNPPRRIWQDGAGKVYVPSGGLCVVSADGKSAGQLQKLGDANAAGWLGINAKNGRLYYGGDRNTRTNREPYRQPFLFEFDNTGKQIERYWEPSPKEIGSDAGHLESDSSVRGIVFRADGKAVVAGWSDGGNSVFTRQVGDWRKQGVGNAPLGMATWGMKSANSLGHVMVVDLEKKETLTHGWFAAFIPTTFQEARTRNAPNHVSLQDVYLLKDEAIAIHGKAATGLIQTPNAFYKYPDDGPKYGGEFVTLLDRDVSRLLFSSYMPGCDVMSLAPTKEGVLIFSRSRGDDGSGNSNGKTASPTTKGVAQEKFGGGADGHVVLLKLPKP